MVSLIWLMLFVCDIKSAKDSIFDLVKSACLSVNTYRN